MSKINELIQTLCPDGVEYKKLGEVATISRGNGFQKKDFVEEGRPCIHYGQIFMYYSKIGIATSETLTCIGNDKYEKNVKALPNDIVMAVTSENVEDVCKCVVWEGDEPVAVSGHTAIFHTEMNSKFLAYWFGSSDFYIQKVRLAHGTKVIEVTPAAMMDIVLPVPPIPVQEEIVRILDEYTDLEAELEAKLSEEIELKQKQYEVYRDELLTFGDNVEQYGITEIFDLRNGYTPSKSVKEYWENGTVDWFRMEDIREHGNVLSEAIQKVSESAVKGGKKIKANSIALATTATIGEHALIIVDCLGNQRFTFFTKSELFFDKVNMDFMNYYFFKIDEWCKTHTRQGNFASVDMDALKQLKIPVPSITEQERIVKILDKYDTYTRDMISALNTELESRKKQYAYYRDQLLTFKRKE